MMKVAYVIGGLPFGGVESWLYDLSLRFMRGGELKARIFNLSGCGEKLPEFLAAGIDVCNVGTSTAALGTHRLDTALRLRRELKAFRPHLVHTLHFSGDYFGRLASLGLGVPVITHIRNIKHEKRLRRQLANKVLSQVTDMYLSVSCAVAELVEHDHNWARKPSKVLYNAIDPSKLDVPAHDLAALYGLASKKVILGVGRYVPQKRFDLILQALRLLLDSGHDVCAVLVGEGRERSSLEKQIVDLKLQKNAVLTGYRQDVAAYLRAATVLAMPSDFEGLPITHLEAMYCGLPAVVSHHVPSLEIAQAASLVCEQTPQSLAEQITRIIDNPDLHDCLAQQGKEIAAAYTMNIYVQSLLEIYTRLIAEKGQKGSAQCAAS